MATLVINKKSMCVKLESDHVVISDHAEPQQAASIVPLANIEKVVVIGQPAISFAVLVRFMEKGIPCTFLSGTGKWRGAIGFDKGYFAGRRMRQYEMVKDQKFCLRVAKHLIRAKIGNSRRVIQRLLANRKMKETDEIKSHRIELDAMLKAVDASDGADDLRGIEGIAAVHYFAVLRNFMPEEMRFNGRNRRPPRDPVNALLSWTYSIILEEVIGAIRSHGLDVSVGVLHADKNHSPSLALDLIEPLRTGCCDLLVLNLINHKILRNEHFDTDHETQGVYLNENGRKAFFQVYEQTMRRKFIMPGSNERTDLRQVIDYQVCQYVKMLEHGMDASFFTLP